MPQTRITRGRLAAGVFFLLAVFGLTHYSTGSVPKIIVDRETGETTLVYDFVIVGGGQSGLVLGNRLSEDGRNTVLVVEYGYLYHDDPLIARPWLPFDEPHGVYHDPKLMYNYTSIPTPSLKNRKTKVEAAATVGGGSTVNGMFLNRGAAWDYDAWARLGNPGWAWDDLLPYFRKSVTFTPPGKLLEEEFNTTYDVDEAYGGKGPIHLSNPAWAWPGQKNQIEGWEELGVPKSDEGAGGNAVGVFWVPRAQDPATETRSYSVTGHLDPAMKRRNFELVTGQHVEKIILSEGRAAGVQIKARNGTRITDIHARKEVIMCAGGLHTPIILQRSGIGPRHILERAGVEVLVDLPGVGMNFQDHPAGGLGHSYETDLALNPSNLTAGSEYQIEMAEQFATERTGPYVGGHNAVVFLPGPNFLPNMNTTMVKISKQGIEEFLPEDYAHDETLIAGYAAQRKLIKEAFGLRNATLMEIPIAGDPYILMILQKPLSRGTVTINPDSPWDGKPLIDTQTIRNPVDLEVMISTARFAREWTATKAMKVLTPLENWPGADKQSDEDLEDHLRGMMESGIGHESGTCSMMPLEKGGVVGPDLTVYGVRGLSIADASIMPLIPSTNLCATVYAVAEKAADLVKKRHGMKIVVQH